MTCGQPLSGRPLNPIVDSLAKGHTGTKGISPRSERHLAIPAEYLDVTEFVTVRSHFCYLKAGRYRTTTTGRSARWITLWVVLPTSRPVTPL